MNFLNTILHVSKSYLFIFLVLLSFGTKAEKTYGICTIQAEPDGSDIITLEGDVFIYTAPHSNAYYKVLLECFVYKKDCYDNLRLNNKTKLYDKQFKRIGSTLTDFNPMKFVEENDSMLLVQISGYLHKSSINPETIPEINLSELLMKAPVNAKLDYFKNHLETFGYKPFDEALSYRSYIIYEPDFVRQTMNPRILMIFHEDELIAIFLYP